MSHSSEAAAEPTPAHRSATVRKVMLRIMPLVLAGYIMAYVDRVNLGFAQLGMGPELGITAAAYGTAAAIFFIAYFIFEVPSNLLMEKFGARVWLARIMLTWGVITVCTGFITSIPMLYLLRFLLGVAEAGFFPGVLLYLTYWFRGRERATALGWLILAQPVAFVIGGVAGGLILDNVEWFGLSPWRWVFILTGLPTIVIGVLTLVFLPSSPATARWLTDSERDWIVRGVAAERGETGPRKHGMRDQLAALRDRRVLHLAAAHITFAIGAYGFNLFLPLVLKQINPEYSSTNIGLVSVVPYLLGGVALMVSSRIARNAAHQRMATLLPALVAGVGLSGVVLLRDDPSLALVAVSVTAIGLFAFLPPFWALVTGGLPSVYAAVGIAAINSVGNLGGFVGPYLVGQGAQGSQVTAGLVVPIIGFFVSAVLVLLWRSPRPTGPRSGDDVVSGAPPAGSA
ncbi:MFS transporter [Pseudonocardia alni]|uniref:MFS transporter n=1 Tax=Pseudonocardia alni TaxID=33907 RepID=UPI00331BDA0B